MSSRSFFRRSQPHRKVSRANQRHTGRRPRFEEFEDRRMLAFSPLANYAVGQSPQAIVARTLTMTTSWTWRSRTTLAAPLACFWATPTARSSRH